MDVRWAFKELPRTRTLKERVDLAIVVASSAALTARATRACLKMRYLV